MEAEVRCCATLHGYVWQQVYDYDKYKYSKSRDSGSAQSV